MNNRTMTIILSLSIVFLTGCGSSNDDQDMTLLDNQLDQIMAAKTLYAMTKGETPLLNTYDWDSIFGEGDGKTLKYDRFGEIDELVFMAPPKTPLTLQRQIRRKTRLGSETIYYKVTSSDYNGEEPLWVDGRFLELQDTRPISEKKSQTATQTLEILRSFIGLPYTWHGSSADGASRLLDYYPPSTEITTRTKGDWILKGFDSLGMLYRASNGISPLDLKSLMVFGEAVTADLAAASDKDEQGNIVDSSIARAKLLMAALKPLDIISMSDRVWVVLDQNEVIESRYRSKFDGDVKTQALYDTLVGLFKKAVFVKDPFQEIEDKNAKRFFIRRSIDLSPIIAELTNPPLETANETTANTDAEPMTDPTTTPR